MSPTRVFNWQSPRPALRWSTLSILCLLSKPLLGAEIAADPTDYLTKFDTLQPGDVLSLAGGDYTDGLWIEDVEGQDGLPITISGPSSGTPARFIGRSCCNTVDIKNAAYITFRNLVFDGDGQAVDAIKAGGGASDWTHHITVEGCTFTNHDAGQTNQQVVAISTKIVSWDWLVRGNIIDGAGTGVYFGNSDGSAAFIGGVIEGNLFADTLGYNMQIKHQDARESVPNVPTDQRRIVIRHNVFIKKDNPNPDGGRPNLLVSGFPDSGAGSEDHIEIYGNFFYHNDDDSLLQASGRLHIHDNIFVDSPNSAIRLVEHQGKTVIDALVYNNTIYDVGRGINFSSAPSGLSVVTGNAVFSPDPISGVNGDVDNISDSVANASLYLTNPSTTLGGMDFTPQGAMITGDAIDSNAANSDLDYDRDFNGTSKDFTFRGAYHGEGGNTAWAPDATLKPLPNGSSGSTGAGGNASSGASSGSGTSSGSGSGAGGAGNGANGNADDDSGCSCHLVGPNGLPPARGLAWLTLGWVLYARRRPTRRR